MRDADEHGGVGAAALRRARSREVPLGHALLAVVVAALGALLLVQSLSSAPRSVELVEPEVTLAAPQAPADRVASVADALLLRAAFSVVPDLRVASPSVVASRPASVTAGLFGASGLRPAGLVLPSRTTGAPGEAVSGVLWAAYERASLRVRASCHLAPSLLAAIGEVESGSLAGRRLDARHNVVPPVLGPTLAGGGLAAIRDSDAGLWDGDPVWDRAVGPMQFIPGTWRVWGSDGNGDGIADPQNVEDATYSAARYLCAGGRDLSDPADLRTAILSYNHSMSYLARVLELMATIEPGTLPKLGLAPLRPAVGSAPTPTRTSYAVPPASAGTASLPSSSTTAQPATTQPASTTSSSPATESPSVSTSSVTPSSEAALTTTGTSPGTSTGTSTSDAPAAP